MAFSKAAALGNFFFGGCTGARAGAGAGAGTGTGAGSTSSSSGGGAGPTGADEEPVSSSLSEYPPNKSIPFVYNLIIPECFVRSHILNRNPNHAVIADLLCVFFVPVFPAMSAHSAGGMDGVLLPCLIIVIAFLAGMFFGRGQVKTVVDTVAKFAAHPVYFVCAFVGLTIVCDGRGDVTFRYSSSLRSVELLPTPHRVMDIMVEMT
jgi:hypothetical protein